MSPRLDRREALGRLGYAAGAACGLLGIDCGDGAGRKRATPKTAPDAASLGQDAAAAQGARPRLDAAAGPPPLRDMAMFRGDPARACSGIGPLSARLTLKWRFRTERYHTALRRGGRYRWAGTGWTGQAALKGDRLVMGALDRFLYCLRATSGKVLWRYEAPRQFKSSPCVDQGRVFCGNVDGSVYCFDLATGKRSWRLRTDRPIDSSPAVVGGRLYVGTETGHVLCLDPANGKKHWSTYVGGREGEPGGAGCESSPAVAHGRVYIGCWDGHLYCLDAATGKVEWRAVTYHDTDATPVVVGERVWVGSESSHLFCFDAHTGQERWRFKTGKGIWGSVGYGLVKGAPRVFVGSDDRHLYCLDARKGRLVWAFQADDGIWSSPCVVDGKVFFGAYDGKLRLLDAATGALLWQYQTQGPVLSTACIVRGWLWIGSRDGYFYCFGPQA